MISRYLEGQKHERSHSFDMNRKFLVNCPINHDSQFQIADPSWPERSKDPKKRERFEVSSVDCGLERALLRGGIERLQKMLTAGGKARLIEAIRRYLRSHCTPEEFAEELYRIADECRVFSHQGVMHEPSHRPVLCSPAAAGGEAPVLAASSKPSKRSKICSGTNTNIPFEWKIVMTSRSKSGCPLTCISCS
jgi:hypothetical protein